jgi:hypothetical protein
MVYLLYKTIMHNFKLNMSNLSKIIFSFFCILIFFVLASNVQAATVNYYVDPTGTDNQNSGDDPGTSAWATIQYAITNVSNPTSDTIIINVAAGTYTLDSDDIDVDRSFTDLTLQGASVTTTIIQAHESKDSATQSVFDIEASNTITINDVAIKNGKSSWAGGIDNDGILTINECSIIDNIATGWGGGGVFVRSSGASATINNSTISGNEGSDTGSSRSGAGIKLNTSGTTLVITNSTISGNRSRNNSGYTAGGISNYGGTVTMTNCTVANNISDYKAGGFYQPSGTLYIKNTIIANNSGATGYEDFYRPAGTLNDNGYNIIESEFGSDFTNGVNGNVEGAGTYNLSDTLADNDTVNGTQTLALSSGSVAIDAGNATANNGVTPTSSDQRGLTRLDTIDIGAYELGATNDTTNPTVSYFNPLDEATAVDVDATFEVNFDEVIATSTGNIVLYKTSDDSTVETIDITSSLVTASSTTALLINPSTTLDSETEYYFFIDTTAVDDSVGNSYAGITASTTWSFTTADINNPTVSYFSPADEAIAVDVGATFEINFDETIATSTGNIVFYKTSDDSTVETIDITSALVTASSTTALLINPATDLNYEIEYYIMVDATAVDDSSGNSYAGITASTTWSFTTVDTPACPTIDNASTYNAYPTCGVATCNSGYTLTDGSCVANPSGGIAIAPPTPTIIAPPIISHTNNTVIYTIKNAHQIAISETPNFAGTSWVPYTESYKFSDKTLYIKFRSKEGGVTEVFTIEPNNSYTLSTSYEGKLIKYNNSPKVYLIKNNNKHWIKDEKTFNDSGYQWDDIHIIESEIKYSDGKPLANNNYYNFTKNLKFGISEEDVRELQKYLNNNNFEVAPKGYPGAPGHETSMFGYATQNALIKFQQINDITPAVGYFGPITRGLINEM